MDQWDRIEVHSLSEFIFLVDFVLCCTEIVLYYDVCPVGNECLDFGALLCEHLHVIGLSDHPAVVHNEHRYVLQRRLLNDGELFVDIVQPSFHPPQVCQIHLLYDVLQVHYLCDLVH